MIIPTEEEILRYTESLEQMLEGDRQSDPPLSFSTTKGISLPYMFYWRIKKINILIAYFFLQALMEAV